MSVAVTESPVITEGGIVKNLFAGFLPVEYKFKREDLSITSVGLGVGSFVRITIGSDLTSILSIGDQVYLNAIGTTGYQYDETGTITAITANTIDAEINFVESSNTGYINYLKNWHLECELIDPDNSSIKILPFSLIDDGDNAGNVTIDTSIANDLNIIFFEYITQLLEESRVVFKVQYREVYEDSSTTFTLIDQEIILYYGTEQAEYESLINELDEPKLWKGYPYGIILTHSKLNNDGSGLAISFDELDINQSLLVADNAITTLNASEQGLFFINLDKDFVYDSDTEYIEFVAEYSTLPDFSPDDFSSDFKIT